MQRSRLASGGGRGRGGQLPQRGLGAPPAELGELPPEPLLQHVGPPPPLRARLAAHLLALLVHLLESAV